MIPVSRKSKRRRRSSRRADFGIERTLESDGVDFFFLLTGLTVSLCALFLTWSLFASPPQSKRLLEGSTTAGKTPTTGGQKEFAASVNSLTADQCVTWLEKNPVPQDWSPGQRALGHQQRLKVSLRMLTRKLDASQRDFAILEQLNSLTDLFLIGWKFPDLNIPDVGVKLRDAAQAQPMQTATDLSVAAQLGLINYESYLHEPSQGSQLNNGDGTRMNSKRVAELITGLLQQLDRQPEETASPHLTRVIKVVDSIMQNLQQVDYAPHELDAGTSPLIDLVQRLTAERENFKSLPVKRACYDWQNQLLLKQLSVQFKNRWIDGAAGKTRVVKTTRKIIEQPHLGTPAFDQIISVAMAFELSDDFDEARQIYEALIDQTSPAETSQATHVAQRDALDGLVRIELVGKPFELTGVDSEGQTLAPDQFSNRPVAIIFWSTRNNNSIQALDRFHQLAVEMSRRRLVIIAYCLDQEPSEVFAQQAKKHPVFRFLSNSTNSPENASILAQCPGRQVPRFMLINKKGVVTDANIEGSELTTQAELLTNE